MLRRRIGRSDAGWRNLYDATETAASLRNACLHNPIELGLREHAELGDEDDPCAWHARRRRIAWRERGAAAGELKHHLTPRLLDRFKQALCARQLRRQLADGLLQARQRER